MRAGWRAVANADRAAALRRKPKGMERMIKAGTKWVSPMGDVCEFMKDLGEKHLITCNSVKLNGNYPSANSLVPRWMMHTCEDGRFKLLLTPPEGVKVILPETAE